MVLQYSKLFHSKVSTGFLQEYSQSSFSFGKIQTLGGPELSEEKNLWIALAESRSMRGASHQPIFMGDCLTICHTYLPCLPREWISFCVLGPA